MYVRAQFPIACNKLDNSYFYVLAIVRTRFVVKNSVIFFWSMTVLPVGSCSFMIKTSFSEI